MSTTKITPIGDRVMVRPVAEDNQSELVIPDSAREKPQKAIVIAVGKDIDPKEIAEGDTVYHRKLAGTEIIIDDIQHLFLSRGKGDIFAAIKQVSEPSPMAPSELV